MPERGFDTAYWGDPFVMKLPRDGKLLFAYLWTNPHCNPAGLYEIALETIAFETKLAEADIPSLFGLLRPKIEWYPEENLVWVKNFIKRQSKSSKFLAAAAKSLTSIHSNNVIEELLDYNLKRYGISIPYQYYMDRLSILTRASASASDTVSVSESGGGGVVKGKGQLGSESKLVGQQADLLRQLRCLKHWRTTEDDVEWLQQFTQEFPEFSRDMMTACTDYYSERPEAKHKGDWKNRLRNWMRKEREFKEKGGKLVGKQARRRPIKYIRGAGELGEEGKQDMP